MMQNFQVSPIFHRNQQKSGYAIHKKTEGCSTLKKSTSAQRFRETMRQSHTHATKVEEKKQIRVAP